MFMNKVAVQAAPVEEDEVLELVVAEELVAAMLQPLPTPTSSSLLFLVQQWS
jgi:hypothetical protein